MLKDILKEWFGYSRRERRSSSILLAVIVAVFILRYLAPSGKNELRDIPVDMRLTGQGPKVDSLRRNGNPKAGLQRASPEKGRKLLDINSCDSSSLVELPGIGPVLSVRIIKYRNLIGGYLSPDQLREVYGLSDETFARIRSGLYADTSRIRKIRINEAGYGELARHPYFQKGEAGAVIRYREEKGRIGSLSELAVNRILSSETLTRIGRYLDFGENDPTVGLSAADQ